MVKAFIAISTAMVLCVALGVVGWLSIHNVNTTPFLYFFGTAIAPTIGIMWNNFKTAKVADKVDDVKGEVQTISHQTNGVLTERIKTAVAEAMNDQQKTMTEAVNDAFKSQAATELEGGK